MEDDPSVPWICLVFPIWLIHAQMLVLALRIDSIADEVTRVYNDACTALHRQPIMLGQLGFGIR